MYLELDRLSKQFDGKYAVHDLSLGLEEGGLLCILGSSGCGKTTTLNMIGGFLKPDGGRVLLDGQDITALPPERRPVSTVFQSYGLFPHMSVLQNVTYGLKFRGYSRTEAKEKGRRYLTLVGLAERENARIGELSGGQQRRVAFAGVLAMEPEVLVLDEPMAGLDPAARRDFLELIGRLHDEGLTVVMVSHSMDDLANCCDRIVVMNEGAVFAEGTPSQVFAHANALKSIGLGVPAAQRMALALAQAGVPLRCDKLYTVGTLADELAGLLLGCADGPLRVPCQAGSKIATREEGC